MHACGGDVLTSTRTIATPTAWSIKELSDMKRAIFSLMTVAVFVGLVGCISQHGRRPWACMGGSCVQAPENCQSCNEPCDNGGDPGRVLRCHGCGGLGCKLCCHGRAVEAPEAAPSGPPTGAVTYPYYTTRGPRDFLAKNPPSIGP